MTTGKRIDCKLLALGENAGDALHSRLKRRILDLIADGKLRVGDFLPSRNQIQTSLGISSTPYHKAVNELIHDGILSASKGKGVFVHSLHGRHAPEHVITLLVSEPETLEHIAFSEVINGILDEIVPSDYSLKFTFFRPAASSREEITAKLQTLRSEGAIVPYCAETHQEQLLGLRELRIPVVFLGKRMRKISPLTVVTDSRKALSDFMAHFGKKDISLAYVGQPLEIFYRKHSSWIRRACEANGVRLRTLRHYLCSFSQAGGASAAEQLLKEGCLPDVIVAEDDYVACGILSVLAHQAVACPLVTIGGFLKHLYPLNEYPAIDLNYRKTGRAAAQLLLSALKGTVKETSIAVESEFYK